MDASPKSDRPHLLEDEHAVVRAEQLGDEELEELLLHAARVDAVLPNEVHAQRFEEVPRPLPCDLVQGVLLRRRIIRYLKERKASSSFREKKE